MTGSRKRRPLSWRRKLLRTGLVLGIIGALLVFFLPSMYTSLIKSQVKLKRDSEMFKQWLTFPVPLTTKFHFFHVLNPDEAMSGAKVKLREVGPFTMEQWRRKEVVDWGLNDETVIYNEYKKYIFKPELSDDWDQEITTINPVVAGLATTIEETMETVPLMQKVVSPFLYSIVGGALIAHGHNLFLKTTPRKLLQGHHINIFETASEMVKPFSVFGIKKEDLLPTEDLPNNAFGILNGKNNTPMGPYEINTGIYDQSKYAYMVSYKGERKMHKWPTDYCNRIYGTDGAQFPPFRSKKDKLPIFTPDLCRTLYVIYDQEAEFKGIPVWRMKLDPKMFETPAMNKDNECYCPHLKKRPERCSIRGTMDLSGCLNGAPLVMSAPHFLGTEPNLADLVEGLEPNKKKHEFIMYFEPRLGSPVYAFARLQLSIRVERTSFLRGFDQVRNAFIPFVWIEESGGVDDFLATILRVILVYVIDGSQSVAWFIMVIGWIVAAVCFFYGVFCAGRKVESEERLYSGSKDQSKTRLAHVDSDVEEEGVDGVDSEGSTHETANLRNNSEEMRASAPTLDKEREAMTHAMPAMPTSRYVPIYRKTTTVVQQHHTRSSSSKNVMTTTSPTSVTTTTLTRVSSGGRPLSSLSAKSLPRIRDLDEIRATIPLVDKNAL